MDPFLLCLVFFSLIKKPNASQIYDHEYRLPDTFSPISYDLTLTLNSYTDRVVGMVQIQFQCKNSTNRIILHAYPMHIFVEHALLENRLLSEDSPLTFPITNTSRQTVTFYLDEELIEDHVYYLSIWYITKYTHTNYGIIKKLDEKNRQYFVNTLLEPGYARMVMPCFDEPRFRASFKLELWLGGKFANSGYVALSSTKSTKTVWNTNLTIWSFEPTPPIPSYIFTLAVGKFKMYCEESELIGREICIWRMSNRMNWNDTASVVIGEVAKFQRGMIDYLGADPNVQLHILNVPSRVRGMENYGLLNMRENLWPINSEDDGLHDFMRTMYHELAHQWFGNMVTMKWWNDVWLSEGLTTFVSSRRPIVVNPAHDPHTFPIIHNMWAVSLPPIAYSKSAAILEMLEYVLGGKRMRTLLQTFVRRFQYKAADTKDFLSVLQEVTDGDPIPVKFMWNWLTTGSQPILFIAFNHSARRFEFTQTGQMPTTAPSRWWIPLWVECLAGTVPERLVWLPPHKPFQLSLHNLTRTNNTDAVAFNRNKSVYYQLAFQY